jgi:hypothetical protein
VKLEFHGSKVAFDAGSLAYSQTFVNSFASEGNHPATIVSPGSPEILESACARTLAAAVN